MAGSDISGPPGELVGVEDTVAGAHEDRGGSRPGLGLGDAGHRRPDDPGHLHGRVRVDQAHGHHGLEQPDGLDVHVGEDGVVVAHVEEAEGPPEAPCRLDGDVGGLGHLGLGHPTLGGNHHPVHDEEIEHVVGRRPVDLLVGAAQLDEEGAHPVQGLTAGLTGDGWVVRHSGHPTGEACGRPR